MANGTNQEIDMNIVKDDEGKVKLNISISIGTYIRLVNLLHAIYNWVDTEAKYNHPSSKIRLIKEEINITLKALRQAREIKD